MLISFDNKKHDGTERARLVTELANQTWLTNRNEVLRDACCKSRGKWMTKPCYTFLKSDLDRFGHARHLQTVGCLVGCVLTHFRFRETALSRLYGAVEWLYNWWYWFVRDSWREIPWCKTLERPTRNLTIGRCRPDQMQWPAVCSDHRVIKDYLTKMDILEQDLIKFAKLSPWASGLAILLYRLDQPESVFGGNQSNPRRHLISIIQSLC